MGFVSLAIIGFVAFTSLHGNANKGSSLLRIDSISPTQGPEGTLVTLTGAGFSTNADPVNPMDKQEKKNTLPPGNYLKIEGKITGSGVFSADGTTLEYKLDLNNTKAAKECTKKLNKEKDCKIGLKVVDASGKESNEVHFLVTPSATDTSFIPTPVLSSFAIFYHMLPRTLEYQVAFSFDSNTVSQVKAFRIYKKTPADSTFNLVATFANPSSLLSADPNNCCQPGPSTFGPWKMASYPNGMWNATSETFLAPSDYPDGKYDFYVAAVDSTGTERKPSPIMTMYVVGRATVSSPTANQPTSATPTVTYKVINSTPPVINYTVRAFSLTASLPDFHDLVGSDARTVNPTTQTEDSYTFSFWPTDSSNMPVVPAGKSYYLEAEGFAWAGAGTPVYVVLPDGVNFTVAN